MNEQDHAALLFRGMMSRPIELPSGLTVRPLSAAAIRMMQEGGNAIFGQRSDQGTGEDGELSDEQLEEAAAEILWYHSEDPEVILDHYEAGTVGRAVRRFALARLTAEDSYTFGRKLGEQLAAIHAATAEPVPGKSASGIPPSQPPRQSPPTGSPPTSTSSAATNPPPGSAG